MFWQDWFNYSGDGILFITGWPVYERVDITEYNSFEEMIWCQVPVNNTETLPTGLYKA